MITPEGVRPANRLGSGSHLVASLHLAEALAVIPAEAGTVAAGGLVDVFPIR
ncbi:MAG: hypothetical protein QM708_11070 [Propioniciclava sp.]|uniref:hypothetical protein n=1 Tax=Propioniciclava sp. TaxID=2038686 RepID=UPI0039E3B8BC